MQRRISRDGHPRRGSEADNRGPHDTPEVLVINDLEGCGDLEGGRPHHLGQGIAIVDIYLPHALQRGKPGE
jgi:hypothetical protein